MSRPKQCQFCIGLIVVLIAGRVVWLMAGQNDRNVTMIKQNYKQSPHAIFSRKMDASGVHPSHLNATLGNEDKRLNVNLNSTSEYTRSLVPSMTSSNSTSCLDEDIPYLNTTKLYQNDVDNQATQGLSYKNRQFYLKGKPFRILSGAIHYFRTVPQYWEDRMKKLKACGLNTVETYVSWNLHEPSPGTFHFDGILDVREFIKLAGTLGLYVIFRPGPYICSEWDFGGMPGWLLNDPGMKVRTNYPGYVAAVDRFFGKLLPLVKDLQFAAGGPIIMVQVENEYGVYGPDISHQKFLTCLLKREGIHEFLVTSDNSDNHLDFHLHALPTVNFHTPRNSFSGIAALDPDFPLMVMEFWTGWFDNWGKDGHSTRAASRVNATLQQVLDMGASLNLYMFHGGTNFGFTSGALNFTQFQAFVTSYDYDAVLSEAGDITPKYEAFRDTLLKYHKKTGQQQTFEVPPNAPKASYGSIEIKEILEWKEFLKTLPLGASDQPMHHMESYKDSNGQHSCLGYIVYSHAVQISDIQKIDLSDKRFSEYVHDRLLSILDGNLFHVMHGPKSLIHPTTDIPWNSVLENITKATSSSASVDLDLVVESQGRVGYSPRKRDLFNRQRKGMSDFVYKDIFGDISGWNIRFIKFDEEQNKLLGQSSGWRNLGPGDKRQAPGLLRGYLEVTDTPADTFVNLEGWKKGVVIVNGFNIGRYWDVGPQRTLYLPAPLLKVGQNEIMVFEEESCGKNIQFVNKPNLSGMV